MLFGTIYALIIFSSVSLLASAGEFSTVLVGGGLKDDNDAIWETIIRLGGGAGVARFGVVSAASEDPCCDKDSSWVYYRDQLTKYGAAEVYYIPITEDAPENNENKEVVSKIRSMTGFMFGGGDQLRIIRSFYNTKSYRVASSALIAIKETLIATGGVIAGTSAGTDCQTSNIMISGGDSYEGLVSGSQVFWDPVASPRVQDLTGYDHGIGLFPHGLLDTHFENRGRQGRLARLLMDTRGYPTGSRVAFGVDENTALVVTGPMNHRVGYVIGQRGVMMMDGSNAVLVQDGNYTVIQHIAISHLTNGDVIDLSSYSMTPASYKSVVVEETGKAVRASQDIFASEGDVTNTPTFEFNRMAQGLFESNTKTVTGYTREADPIQYKVVMSKEGTSVGYEGVDPSSGVNSFSYSNMIVDMIV